jgi:hypothetical protein
MVKASLKLVGRPHARLLGVFHKILTEICHRIDSFVKLFLKSKAEVKTIQVCLRSLWFRDHKNR